MSTDDRTEDRTGSPAGENPLLHVQFEVPFQSIGAAHVEPAVDALLERARADIETIASATEPATYENTLGALERSGLGLEYAMGIVGHLESVVTNDALREAYNAVQPKVAAFSSSIPLHAGLWRRLQALGKSDEVATLDPTRRRHLDKTLDEFRRHGAELDDAGKAELQRIDVELAMATTKFSENVLDATQAWEMILTDESMLAGLPPSAKEAAAASAQAKGKAGFRFTLQAPSMIAVLTYLDDAGIRRDVWRASNTRATAAPYDNRPVMADILRLRAARAKLLGFANFADLVLVDRMAKNGERARTFLDELRARSEAAFVRENDELLAFRREIEGPDAPALAPWDVAYWAEKQRRARYDFDEEALRPYFAFDAVQRGIFTIAERLLSLIHICSWPIDVSRIASRSPSPGRRTTPAKNSPRSFSVGTTQPRKLSPAVASAAWAAVTLLSSRISAMTTRVRRDTPGTRARSPARTRSTSVSSVRIVCASGCAWLPSASNSTRLAASRSDRTMRPSSSSGRTR